MTQREERIKRRNLEAKELWENKDFRIRVEIPKTKKRQKLRPVDILNLDLEELEDLD